MSELNSKLEPARSPERHVAGTVSTSLSVNDRIVSVTHDSGIPNVPLEQPNSISRTAHIIERVGLATAGALCGLFVAACVIRANTGALDSTGFIATMCLIGVVGFYLGIDLPEARAHAIQTRSKGFELEVNPVELLSASGTFLTAMAALVSVYVIVFDETPQLTVTAVVGCGWLFGATMLVGAGTMARRAQPVSQSDEV